MIHTENIDPKTLRVGDIILTEEKFMVVTKIDENGIEVLEPNLQFTKIEVKADSENGKQ